MRRALLITGALLAAVAVVGLGLRALQGRSRGYVVRAVFDNAAYAAPGEQVRIAGAPVGTIVSESVTPQHLAVLTLEVTTPGFAPWHRDATCLIRPQSLIAERYLDCSPGTAAAPPLSTLHSGPGAGTHLLPVTQTSSPVDPDIVQSISTEPVREALAVILDELGTGLAARGSDLNAVILRADPGLAATQRVFALLAAQSHTLARLASDADAVLGPLARARRSLAQFVVSADTTAASAATQSPAIAASIHALPPFLTQLRPLMADLSRLAQEGTPALGHLGASAGALQRQFTTLVPFAARARRALDALARTAAASQGRLLATQPLITHLGALGAAAGPTAGSLARLTASLNSTGAIGDLLALLFNGAGATNGFDTKGHYLRTDLQVGSCTGYARAPVPGCSAHFPAAARTAGLATAGTAARLGGLLHYLTGGGA
ncbi:MAG TPA: MlaD family protein [Solirubrobacteraceae bacterium]|nr:MlaD family protein [Solirubrobacteraceae bacterium]